MIHIGITAKIKDFGVPFFLGYFKIPKDQDLKASARAAVQRYVKDKNWADFPKKLVEVDIYEKETNKTLLIIKI